MDIFWKAIGGTLVATVFSLVLSKRNPDMGILLNLAVSTMLLLLGLGFLKPVLDFFRTLETVGALDPENLGVLTKAAALGMVTQLASMLCQDAGNGALGKGLEMLGVSAVLWVSLPLFSGLLELLQNILEHI